MWTRENEWERKSLSSYFYKVHMIPFLEFFVSQTFSVLCILPTLYSVDWKEGRFYIFNFHEVHDLPTAIAGLEQATYISQFPIQGSSCSRIEIIWSQTLSFPIGFEVLD